MRLNIITNFKLLIRRLIESSNKVKNKTYRFYRQLDEMDCGPTCLKMIASFHGREIDIDYLRSLSSVTMQGVTINGLCEAAEKIGFEALPVNISFNKLIEEMPLPCILHWNNNHFVVLYEIIEKKLYFDRKKTNRHFIIADPKHNIIDLSEEDLLKFWLPNNRQKGIVLGLQLKVNTEAVEQKSSNSKAGLLFLFKHLIPYKKYIFQLMGGMLLSSLLSLIFPFLTQSMVDFGIQHSNTQFLYLILGSQVLVFIGGIIVEMIRNWILLHINTRVSVTIVSNFLAKLMKLPISYFESKNIGDVTQRIDDHHRVERFLTGSSLSTMFSLVHIIIFSAILAYYDLSIFLIFASGSFISIVWILLFMKRRKNLDYIRFQKLKDNQNSIFEIVNSMQEIKLNNCEQMRRWNWERIEAELFKVNIKSLSLEQYQQLGSSFLTQLKNIFISCVAAFAVINNEITLGVMLSISYIVGQLNSPLDQIIVFLKGLQDAKLSMERLSEIHNKPNEEDNVKTDINYVINSTATVLNESELGHTFVGPKGIHLDNVSFRYGGTSSMWVLKNINLFIPHGKITAIVGSSGSGKTTLLKLLLKFYPPTDGNIYVNDIDLNELSAMEWRKLCGTVMQEGYIFNDTVSKNIATSADFPDNELLTHSISVANIQEFISGLPLRLSTVIGSTGIGLSGGQKQRLLIARAVYKQPTYIFFDEATSSLDADNEKIIMGNLNKFFKGRTVLVIAHRLSTVKNADQIVVLGKGEIQEIGNHYGLIKNKGKYFELVKNQLEMDVA